MQSYKYNTSQTGSKFVVFAEGFGAIFGLRAWVENLGGNSAKNDPCSILSVRFRVESDGTDASDGKALSKLFGAVLWNSGSKQHASALATIKINGLINGSTLVGLIKQQGVLKVMYAAWQAALDQTGVKMILSESEFETAIITTMEGEITDKSDLEVTLPFTKGVLSIAAQDAQEEAVQAATQKVVGLN